MSERVFEQVAKVMADMQADHDRLHAALDAVLALAEKFDADEVTVISGRGFQLSYSGSVVASRIRAALAPVADPDPHTTSDEEQQ